MPQIALLLLFLGVLAFGFGYWGLHTEQGRARFDEMAGMIPMAFYWLGLLLMGLAGAMGLFVYFRR